MKDGQGTVLVATFREILRDRLAFGGNRELILSLYDPLPVHEVSLCLAMALRYHQITHLPLLGFEL